MFAGLCIAGATFAMALLTFRTQIRALSRVRASVLPSDDRAYLTTQAKRRLKIGGVLGVLALMIAAGHLSGMEARADLPLDGDRGFARMYVAFWCAVLGGVAIVVVLAGWDMWTTRWYGVQQLRRIRGEQETLLRRDLAIRQTSRRGRFSGTSEPDEPRRE